MQAAIPIDPEGVAPALPRYGSMRSATPAGSEGWILSLSGGGATLATGYFPEGLRPSGKLAALLTKSRYELDAAVRA